jgi:hypothetical protein
MEDRHSMAVRADARSAGMVTAQTTRVTAPWATMRQNVRGFAPTDEGRELASQGVSSVKVTYADGTSETRSVHSFRKGRTTTRNYAKTAPAAKASDCQRMAATIGYTGDQNH